MCGRFTLAITLEELLLRFDIGGGRFTDFHLPRYNIAPGQPIPAVIHDGTQHRMGLLRWGLVPSWSRNEKTGGHMINARAETLAEKPAFKNLIARKRCIIPADGFYEWKRQGKEKQPMRIRLKSGNIFAMAGLYDIWQSPDGRKLSTCTIITTSPNRLVENIHNRMPVILQPQDEKAWLDRSNQDREQLLSILRPYPEEEMEAYPVSKRVGQVRVDSRELIERVEPVKGDSR